MRISHFPTCKHTKCVQDTSTCKILQVLDLTRLHPVVYQTPSCGSPIFWGKITVWEFQPTTRLCNDWWEMFENFWKHFRSTHQSNHNTSQYPCRPGKTCQWWPSWPVGHLQALLKASWSSPQGRRKSRPWSHSRQGCQSCSHRSHRWTQQSQSRQRSEPIQQLAPWKLLQVRWGCQRTSGLRMETRSLALAA